MAIPNPQRAAGLRRVIDEFLSARQKDKLEKVKDDGSAPEKAASERDALKQKYRPKTWIDDAASRADHIQVVTHAIKFTHGQIKKRTNIYKPPTELPAHSIVGSHSLGNEFEGDTAIDDAKHLDVSAFVKLEFEGCSLLDLMLAGDPDLPAALSEDTEQAAAWIESFTSVMKPRGKMSSDTLAKQIYWLTCGDPSIERNYHLLAPMYATSLAHRVYQTINADRFSEASKVARQARKDGHFTDQVLHDYPNMAVQKLGGTKPQNISQLNLERRGDNYLLASLPPRWKSIDLRPLLNTDSMFLGFGRRPDVKQGVRTLRAFLITDPPPNAKTRKRLDALVTELVGELLVFGAELRTLPPGWSQASDCRLSAAERYWLDPDGVAIAAEQSGRASPASSAEQISQAFGRWLNREMRDPLPMGDAEYLQWCALAQGELDAEEWEMNHAA